MIIDAHCHAWMRWPYEPAVPDPESRARVENLLWEMDRNDVARAILISAGIAENPDNSGYTAACAQVKPDRLVAFPDVDCRWSATHHTPGASERLRAAIARFNPVGVTHYLHEDRDPGWLLSEEGFAFFGVAEAHRLIVSLAIGPEQTPAVRALAERFPATPFLIHHLGRVMAQPLDGAGLNDMLAAAEAPNIHVKLSGFGYGVSDGWNFPCAPARDIVRALHDAYGPGRLIWGSDYPVSQRYMTYRQSLEIVRSHCDFIGADDMDGVLGGNIGALLAGAGTP